MQEVLLLIGHGSRDDAGIAEYNAFAEALAARLQVPTQPCFLEFAEPPIAEGVRLAIEQHQAQHIVALPLFLGPAGHQKNDVPAVINWARAQWQGVNITYGTPIGAHYGIVAAMEQRISEVLPTAHHPEETAVLVVGRGSRDPDSNSDVAKMARLLWEGGRYAWVESAFYSLTQPDVATGIQNCIKLGAKRVVVLPYLLFTGRIDKRIIELSAALAAQYPEVEILNAAALGIQDGVLEAVAQRYSEALSGVAAMTCDLCKYRHRMTGFENEFALPQFSDHHHGLRGVSHTHGGMNYEAEVQKILPPRYQGNAKVDYAPMGGAAELAYDSQGQVAWDTMWEDFCELAIAGGPPHRGDLLEAVTPDVVLADLDGYTRVLAELERGIKLITGLPVLASKAPGWIGMECPSEAMAVWLLRAILVENVMVRREGCTLFFPASPTFRLEKEVKNVITAIAKTHHYWVEHAAQGAN